MQQPGLAEGGISAYYAVENQQNIHSGQIKKLPREGTKFVWRVGTGSIAKRVVIASLTACSVHAVNDLQLAQLPEIARLLPVVLAADGIPEARRVHTLATIVGCFH